MDDHKHDRFLYEKDDQLHYGCINPFCGHGNPALPNHWAVPMETDVVSLRLVSHKDREIVLEITWKRDFLGHHTGEIMPVSMPDNLEASKAEFDKIFHPEKYAVLGIKQ